MKKQTYVLPLLLALLFLAFTGCTAAQSTTAAPELSKKDAGTVIIADLVFHGYSVKQLTVQSITMGADRISAVVAFTVTLTDGSQESGSANLEKEGGQWRVHGHEH